LNDHVLPDVLELYVLGQTTPAEGAHVEEHLAACEACRNFVTTAQWSLSMISAAARRVAGIVATHETADGPVVLTVRAGSGSWVARIRGPDVDSGSSLESESAASEWCHATFRQMFPDHRCSPTCVVRTGASANE
jgi:hypothetical protein